MIGRRGPRMTLTRMLLSTVAAALVHASAANAETVDLSRGWFFHKGEATGAQSPTFDHGDWAPVSVPHDWAIMDRPDGTPPFDRNATAGQDYGYLPGGIGWYRRALSIDADDVDRVAQLRFEAIYMDADIWVNGDHVGRHCYGYTAFALDLTGKLRAGRNVIAVRVNHADPSSRWYAGSGIIRPATLEMLDRVHIDPDGVFVTTPVATTQEAEVVVATPVANRTGAVTVAELVSTLVDATGREVTRAVARQSVTPGGRAAFDQRLSVRQPALWSTDAPNLYRLVQTVSVGGRVVDERATRFGIRNVTFDARNGLLLNGRPVKMRGGNIHHDNYMLGAAGWPDADARKVVLMKRAGYNAIRSSHNPASQATLDAADELGMLVIDEAFDMWNQSKRAQDYSRFFKTEWSRDVESMVVSGRNHPSVVMWSIGNEIPEQGSPSGVATARMLRDRVRELDPTRPVTQAVNMDSPDNAAQFAELDVSGYNYREHLFADDHRTHPNRVMYTSESTSKDAFRYWRAVETMPWVVGDFVWTAVDYLGESGIGWTGYSHDWKKLAPYPWHLAYSGEIDATGRKRPAAYYREILWDTGAPVAAFVRQPAGTADLPDRNLYDPPAELDWSLDDVHQSWTWPGQEGKPLEVVVYSRLPEVELRLNGKPVGRKTVGVANEYKASFTVPYAPGTLTAVGLRDGRPVSEWQLRTAGPAARIELTLDRSRADANGRDLTYVTARLLDQDGVPVYAQSDDLDLKLEITGAGKLIGTGSGHPRRIASFQGNDVRTFHGQAVAVVQSMDVPGEVEIRVSGGKLPVAHVSFDAVSSPR